MAKEKKIAIFTFKNHWDPQNSNNFGISESEKEIVYLARSLAKVGYDVTIFANPSADSPPEANPRCITWPKPDQNGLLRFNGKFDFAINWKKVMGGKNIARKVYLWPPDQTVLNLTNDQFDDIEGVFWFSDIQRKVWMSVNPNFEKYEKIFNLDENPIHYSQTEWDSKVAGWKKHFDSILPKGKSFEKKQTKIDPEKIYFTENKDKTDFIQYIQNFPSQDYEVYDVPNLGQFFIDNPNDLIKFQLSSGRMWEKNIIELIKKYAKPGSTVLDIGAHIGTHTLTMAKSVDSTGKVLAFEPQPKIFRELFMNMSLNNINNVNFFLKAIGNKKAFIELSPLWVGHEGGTTLKGGTGQYIDLIDLDSLNLTNVSLMKIDVEFMEDEALEGARLTIQKNKPVIIIEVQGPKFNDTMMKLKNFGYFIYELGPQDFLALPTP